MPSFASIAGLPTVNYRHMVPDPSLVVPDCLVGVEMELEGDLHEEARNDPGHSSHMVSAHSDGSLRNGGVELVFAGPLMGDAALHALKWMFTIKERYSLTGSMRTSTHMHINYASNDDTTESLLNSVLVWLLIEKSMAITTGPHREYNSYCMPSYMMHPSREAAMYRLATVGTSDAAYLEVAIDRALDMPRYAALNLAALRKYGSLEYRLLGTADYESTLSWLNILLSIKKAARENDREALLGCETLPDFLNEFMPQVAELVVVNAPACEQYNYARKWLLDSLSPPEEPWLIEHASPDEPEEYEYEVPEEEWDAEDSEEEDSEEEDSGPPSYDDDTPTEDAPVSLMDILLSDTTVPQPPLGTPSLGDVNEAIALVRRVLDNNVLWYTNRQLFVDAYPTARGTIADPRTLRCWEEGTAWLQHWVSVLGTHTETNGGNIAEQLYTALDLPLPNINRASLAMRIYTLANHHNDAAIIAHLFPDWVAIVREW